MISVRTAAPSDSPAAAGFGYRGDVELPESITIWSTGRPLLSRYERPVR